MRFTERFNQSLKDNHVNQARLALSCGISRQLVTEFRKGRAFPSLEVFYRICEYLDESADYLLGLSDS